jgi:hypothetical protein
MSKAAQVPSAVAPRNETLLLFMKPEARPFSTTAAVSDPQENKFRQYEEAVDRLLSVVTGCPTEVTAAGTSGADSMVGEVQPLELLQRLTELVTGAEADGIATAVVQALGSGGQLLPLASSAITWEVQAASAAMVFRSSSLNMRLITAVARVYGTSYLTRMVTPLIDQMLQTPTLSYEVSTQQIHNTSLSCCCLQAS